MSIGDIIAVKGTTTDIWLGQIMAIHSTKFDVSWFEVAKESGVYAISKNYGDVKKQILAKVKNWKRGIVPSNIMMSPLKRKC